jgi:hypothetical protein
MSNINKMVESVLQEAPGTTAGVEMYNDGPKGQGAVQAGLFAEPGLSAKDGSRGNKGSNDSAGEKVEKQYGSNQSKFDKEDSPGNSEPNLKTVNPEAGTTPPVNKFGDEKQHAKVASLLDKINSNVIKSSDVKNKLKDSPELSSSSPAPK